MILYEIGTNRLNYAQVFFKIYSVYDCKTRKKIFSAEKNFGLRRNIQCELHVIQLSWDSGTRLTFRNVTIAIVVTKQLTDLFYIATASAAVFIQQKLKLSFCRTFEFQGGFEEW